jgi:hypothetical protein
MNDERRIAAMSTLTALVGTWRGTGVVELPSMEPIDFEEEIRFARRSPDSLDYWQRAVAARDKSMLHSESGIWRTTAAGALEVTVALPGATEVSEGTIGNGSIRLSSTAVGVAATGAMLRSTVRRYDIAGDVISYEISIATASFSTTGHIRAYLRRSGRTG